MEPISNTACVTKKQRLGSSGAEGKTKYYYSKQIFNLQIIFISSSLVCGEE